VAVLFYASSLFGLAFISQVIVWRVHLPNRQTKVICLLFFGFLSGGSLVFWKHGMAFSVFGLRPPDNLAQFLQFWLYYVSLTLAYVITYSAVEADSPSLIIIMRISESGTKGLSHKGLQALINDEILVEARLRDLLTDKMAELTDGKYRLRAKGVVMAQLFRFYRNIMGANKGG
jgi:hypothetical protein